MVKVRDSVEKMTRAEQINFIKNSTAIVFFEFLGNHRLTIRADPLVDLPIAVVVDMAMIHSSLALPIFGLTVKSCKYTCTGPCGHFVCCG